MCQYPLICTFHNEIRQDTIIYRDSLIIRAFSLMSSFVNLPSGHPCFCFAIVYILFNYTNMHYNYEHNYYYPLDGSAVVPLASLRSLNCCEDELC